MAGPSCWNGMIGMHGMGWRQVHTYGDTMCMRMQYTVTMRYGSTKQQHHHLLPHSPPHPHLLQAIALHRPFSLASSNPGEPVVPAPLLFVLIFSCPVLVLLTLTSVSFVAYQQQHHTLFSSSTQSTDRLTDYTNNLLLSPLGPVRHFRLSFSWASSTPSTRRHNHAR